MSDKDGDDDGPGGSLLQQEICFSRWVCNGRQFDTKEAAEAYEATYPRSLQTGVHEKWYKTYKTPPTIEEEEKMTTAKPRRLRVRRRTESVDDAVIEKLVEDRLTTRTSALVAKHKAQIMKTGVDAGRSEGHDIGYAAGLRDGVKQGEANAERRRNEREIVAHDGMRPDPVAVRTVSEANPRHENLNNGWGFVTPMEIQRHCTADQMYIYGFFAEMRYENDVRSRMRVFTLRIHKAYQDGTVKLFELSYTFSEESLHDGEGASALIGFLCMLCTMGSRFVDAEMLCEFMADWVTSTRGREDGPTLHVPKSARATALKRFRDAVGLVDG